MAEFARDRNATPSDHALTDAQETNSAETLVVQPGREDDIPPLAGVG